MGGLGGGGVDKRPSRQEALSLLPYPFLALVAQMHPDCGAKRTTATARQQQTFSWTVSSALQCAGSPVRP